MPLSSDESFYICPECGTLTTSTQIDAERENGGDGRCSCRYADLCWDPSSMEFEFIHTGLMCEWTKIPWKVYDRLLAIPSTIIRVRAFETYERWRRGGNHNAD